MSLTARVIFGPNPRRTAVRVLVLAGMSLITFNWVLLPIRTQGISMVPTYQSGKFTFVNRLAFAYGRPRRGDIVAIRLAGLHVVYVKRIVGLPGERVEIIEGQVLVNGKPLLERYVAADRRPWNYAEVTLTPTEYFVIGDNRSMRVSDHDFGRVERSRLVGRLLF